MRRYVVILTLSWMLPLAAYVFVNWLIDPYRIFHKRWLHNDYFTTDLNMRETAAGIINTEEFDSIILGSSMAANFSSNEASQLFGTRFVNISIDGSSISDRSLILGYALRNRDLNDVIFSLDWFSLREPESASLIAPYAYLYDDNQANDLLIYATSLKPFRYIFCRNFLITSDAYCPNTKNDLEELVEWHSNPENIKRFGGLNKWLLAKNDHAIKVALKSISDSIKTIKSDKVKTVNISLVNINVDKYNQRLKSSLLKSAYQYPKTNFYLFFPPYSRLNYALLKQSNPQLFAEYLGLVRLLIRETEKYPNIKVFGFETEGFMDEIANYKDTSHYHHSINSKILNWMKIDKHRLNPLNLEPYIQEITDRASNYPLMQIGLQIDAYLEKGY